MNKMKPASDTNMPEGTVMDLRSARHLLLFSGEIKKWDRHQMGNGDCGETTNSDRKKTCCHSPITCNKVEDTRLPSPSLISYTPSCLEVSLTMTTSLMEPFLPREMRPLYRMS